MPQFRLSINGQEREFEATRQGDRLHLVSDSLTIDARVTTLGNGRFLLEYEDAEGILHRLHLAGDRAGDKRQLWVDGRNLTVTRRRKQATAAEGNDGALSASIPAVVSQILVSEGDEVASGDKLILLESMKMVIPIQAPTEGRVVKINCTAGESVPAGLVLVEIEPL
ncbi:MAG: biotin/lipoyl-containing protein [Chloroflexota bacterium]